MVNNIITKPTKQNKMKLTALEWFVDQLSYTTTDGNIISHHQNITHLFNQARQMEKEQIMEAFNNCENKSAELYYNETYKTE